MYRPLTFRFLFTQMILGIALGSSGCHSSGGKVETWSPWPDLTSWWKQTPKMHQPDPTVMPNDQQKKNTQLLIARSLEQRGDIDEAIHAYEQIGKKQADNGHVHHRLAVLYDKKGDHEQAGEHYRQALAKSQNRSAVLTDFGYSCYLRDDLESAEKHLREAIRLDPDSERAQNNLGLLLARTGRREEALTAFFRAGSSAADAHINLAYALMWERKFNEAERELRTVLKQWPESKKARNALVAMGRAATRADAEADAGSVERLASARRVIPEPAAETAASPLAANRPWPPEPRAITQQVPTQAAPLASPAADPPEEAVYTAARPVVPPRRFPPVDASGPATRR